MLEFRYGFKLEIGDYTPREPRVLTCETPEAAAREAKAIYEANPFGFGEPMKAETIHVTWFENDSYHGLRFDYDTLEILIN